MPELMTFQEIMDKCQAGQPIHTVPIRAWGGKSVRLREADGLAMLEWDTAQIERHKDPGLAARTGTGTEHLVQLCLLKPDTDELMFSTKEQVTSIRKLGGALQEIYQHCLRINRLRMQDTEELGKSSPETPSSDGSSTSQTSPESPSGN